jgi:hypothetical protein
MSTTVTHGHGSGEEPLDDEIAQALDVARALAAAGVPVFVAYPDPEGKTKSGAATGYAIRTGWQKTTPNPAYVDAWRPGLALVAVMGHGLDLADTDPRNGGDLTALTALAPDILGMSRTPSDGWHAFVRSMGVRSRDGVLPGLDVKAGDGEDGWGFAFLPPTVRVSKTTGEAAAYRWVKPPDLGRLGSAQVCARLAELVRAAHGSRKRAGSSKQFQQPGGRRDHAGPVPEGEHHSALVSYAGWMRKRDFPIREAEACMLMRLGDLVPGEQPKYTEDEALAELHDVYSRYDAGDPAAEDGGEPAAAGRRLVLTPASSIEPEPVVWAWEDEGNGRIPSGSFGLFAGREGTGKSSYLIYLTARITSGTLPGSFHGRPRAVIYVAVEDSWKYTIAPRLIAAGADLDLVYRAEVQVVEGETVSLSLPADNQLLAEAITVNRVAMVALDPLMSAISDSLDTHVNREVRRALDPLARLADQTGAVVAGIAHFNKSRGNDASSLITASGAFKDVARFIFAFAADHDDGGQVITQTKNSLGLHNLPSIAYHIAGATVPTAKGDANVGRLVIDGYTDRTVADILGEQGGGDRDALADAEDCLKKILAGGPRRTRDVEDEARQVHSITKRTLERARKSLRIPTAKRADGWWISLPEHEGDLRNAAEGESGPPAKTAKDAKSVPQGDVGGVGGLDPETGPCLQCHRPCRRYGDGGSPLCDDCKEARP